MKTALYLTTAAAALMLGTVPAFAQSMDYGELEETFGEPVTTSATGSPQRASDVPVAMTIVSGEEIRRTGALTLAEALKGHAGVDVNRFSAQQYEVSIRGANQVLNPRVLVMVNGRQVYLDHFGFTSWSNLGVELSEIRQVEIVKGPMSALFGYNAASGVINIITYNPIYDKVREVSAQVGPDGQRQASAVFTVPVGDNFGIRASAGYAVQDEFSALHGHTMSDNDRVNAGVDLAGRITDAITARVNYNFSDSDQLTTTMLYEPADIQYRTNAFQGTINADTALGSIELTGYHNRLRATSFRPWYGPDGWQRTYHEPSLTYNEVSVASLQDVIKLSSRDTLRLMGEYRHNQMRAVPDIQGTTFYRNYAGGAMWEHRFGAGFTVMASGRYDEMHLGQKGVFRDVFDRQPVAPELQQEWHDMYRTTKKHWSWNVGAVVKPGDRTTIRLQASRGYQAPSLTALGNRVVEEIAPNFWSILLGMPFMQPTRADSYEMGLVQQLPFLQGAATVNAFYSKTHPLQSINAFDMCMTPMCDPAEMGYLRYNFGNYFNNGKYKTVGVEATVNGKLSDRLGWRLDYTFLKQNSSFDDPAKMGLEGLFEALTPRHRASLDLNYGSGPVRLDLKGFYRSKVGFPVRMPVPYRPNILVLGVEQRKASFGLNARASVKPTDAFELFLVGENLTNDDFIDNGNIKQSTRARVGASLKF